MADEALVQVQETCLRGMRDVGLNDASRLLFTVALGLGEVVIQRDARWLTLCAEALAAEAAGEPPC